MYRYAINRLVTATIKLPRQIHPRLISSTNTEPMTSSSAFESPEIQKFLNDFHKLMLHGALIAGQSRDTKVCNFKQPEELYKSLDLEVGKEPVSHSKLLELCKNVIQHSIRTGNPNFCNQLYGGPDPFSLAGSWLTDCLNTNIHTYEVAPVFVVMEKYIFQKLCSIIGFKDGDGVFGPGGSFCNMTAIHLARYNYNPDLRKTGMYGSQKLCLFASTEGHYSILKGASFLGIGMENVVRVQTDDIGRMDPNELEKQIIEVKKSGRVPLMVMASAGTTVLGTFDQLDLISDICKKHNVWMHTDAAWGGGVLLSEKWKYLMKGVERSNSVAWNFHKWSAVPIQCSAFVVNQKGLMEKCNATSAEYLFQPDKFYDTSYDIGDKTIQCGRRVDVLKLWLMWKARGDKGLGEVVDRSFENAGYLLKKLKTTEGFKLVYPEFQCTNISFWYIPPRLRGKPETPEWWAEIGKVAPKIKERMMMSGSCMIQYQPLSSKGFVNFFRVIVENPLCGHADMDYIIEKIEEFGRDL